MTAYEPRPVQFLQLWRVDEWRIKLYGTSTCSECTARALALN